MAAGLQMLQCLSFSRLRFYVSWCVDANVCGQICKCVCVYYVWIPDRAGKAGQEMNVAFSTLLFSLR